MVNIKKEFIKLLYILKKMARSNVVVVDGTASLRTTPNRTTWPSSYTDGHLEDTMRLAELSVINGIVNHIERFLVEVDLTPIRTAFEAFTGNRLAKYFHDYDSAKSRFTNGPYGVDIVMQNDDGIYVDFAPTITDTFSKLTPSITLREYAKGVILTDAWGAERKMPFRNAQNRITIADFRLRAQNYALSLYH